MNKSIFEMIIENEIPSLKVYEDENFIAILDINPEQKGHTLLIPKVKKENIIIDSDFTKSNILFVAEKISKLLMQKLKATGVKYIFNNGESAGQVVFHTHLHLIPYYDKEMKPVNDKSVLNEIIN